MPPSNAFKPGLTITTQRTVDRASGGPCAVSEEGFFFYTLPSSSMPPIDFTRVQCNAAATIDGSATPATPAWSIPAAPTQALFVATSLEEAYSVAGMQDIAGIAQTANVPVTWMIGTAEYLAQNAPYYNTLHTQNGDDVELEDTQGLYTIAPQTLPWFTPAVSIEPIGHERNIQDVLALGDGGFWGITWNSQGTDGTSDMGAPWGTYCADESSYKIPSPNGDCSLLAFEWTARDLTRAYFADTLSQGYSAEAAFSTDPDDILERGHFTQSEGIAYERRLVDAYAAAGVTQPLVMMSEQEPGDEANAAGADDPLLAALYQEAVTVGMKPMTLRSALPLAKQFSAAPRAIAFPYIPGGMTTSYDGVPYTPATIDYHDNVAGMTFISGHTMPSRVFTYANDPTSTFNHALVETLPGNSAYPQLTGLTFAGGTFTFSFIASVPTHIGIAIWADPTNLQLSGANVVPAGHAGAVVTFDLPAGASTQTLRCGACTSTTLTYAL